MLGEGEKVIVIRETRAELGPLLIGLAGQLRANRMEPPDLVRNFLSMAEDGRGIFDLWALAEARAGGAKSIYAELGDRLYDSILRKNAHGSFEFQ